MTPASVGLAGGVVAYHVGGQGISIRDASASQRLPEFPLRLRCLLRDQEWQCDQETRRCQAQLLQHLKSSGYRVNGSPPVAMFPHTMCHGCHACRKYPQGQATVRLMASVIIVPQGVLGTSAVRPVHRPYDEVREPVWPTSIRHPMRTVPPARRRRRDRPRPQPTGPAFPSEEEPSTRRAASRGHA